MRLLNLTQETQNALLYNKISERHARGLLRLESPEQQISMLNKIINEKINVKQTEEEIDKILGYNKPTEDLEIPVFEEVTPKIKPINDIDNEKIEVLNPFIESEEILNIDEEQESKNLFKSLDESSQDLSIPSIESVEEKDENIQNKYKYLDIVNDTREFIEDCKSKGLKIISEEYDMDNEYQILLKIEK